MLVDAARGGSERLVVFDSSGIPRDGTDEQAVPVFDQVDVAEDFEDESDVLW